MFRGFLYIFFFFSFGFSLLLFHLILQSIFRLISTLRLWTNYILLFFFAFSSILFHAIAFDALSQKLSHYFVIYFLLFLFCTVAWSGWESLVERSRSYYRYFDFSLLSHLFKRRNKITFHKKKESFVQFFSFFLFYLLRNSRNTCSMSLMKSSKKKYFNWSFPIKLLSIKWCWSADLAF